MRWALGVVARAAALLLGVGVACNSQPAPDYVSARGVQYIYHGVLAWAPEEIEDVETALAECVRHVSGYSRAVEAMRFVRVIVVPDPIPCASGTCNGLEDYHNVYVVDLGSPQKSALAHEITHWLELACKSVTDPGHSNADLWRCAP